jgi:hypothetical protein
MDGVKVKRKLITVNEETTEQILRDVYTLQTQWYKKHGHYTRRFTDLLTLDPKNNHIYQLAKTAPFGVPYFGYVYRFPYEKGDELLKTSDTLVIVATPFDYGTSGRYSYTLDPNGTIHRMDRKGKPVLDAAEIDDSWDVM